MGQLVFQATLGGQVNLVGPNTASTFNINVPAVAGNMVTTGDTSTVTNTMLAGSIANAKLTNSSVTIGSTSVALGATAATVAGLTLTNPVINGFTGDTSVINVGSAQFYKDTSGNVGFSITNTDPVLNRTNGAVILNDGSIRSRTSNIWSLGIATTSGDNIQFWTDNGSSRVSAGRISSNGSVTAYNVTSDYRLKQNIQPMTNTLALISQLKPCTYEYIEGNQYSEGFVAHELQAVVPHAVTGKKDDVDADGNPVYQGVDASFLIPHLVAAVQELAAKVTALEAK